MTSALPVSSAALDQVQHAVGKAAGNQRLDHQAAGQTGRVARLEYDRVAGDQRRGHHSERQCDREVERSDHPEHAIRSQDHAALLGRRGAGPFLAKAVGALHLVAIMADEVDRFLDLADRFEPRLADLDQAGDRNVPLALFEHVGCRRAGSRRAWASPNRANAG